MKLETLYSVTYRATAAMYAIRWSRQCRNWDFTSLKFFFLRILFLQTGTTALFFAAQGGFLDILILLLKEGAPINQASKVGWYMLNYA